MNELDTLMNAIAPAQPPQSVEDALSQPGRGFGGAQPAAQPAAPLDALAPQPAAVAPAKPLEPVTPLDSLSPNNVPRGTDDAPDEMGRDVVDAAKRGAMTASKGGGGGALKRLMDGMGAGKAKPAVAASPSAPVATGASALPSITVAPSAFGRGDASGYDYRGYRVELPQGFPANDRKAAADTIHFTNQVVDWLNDEEG